jgi:phosphatidylserine decarboxylase
LIRFGSRVDVYLPAGTGSQVLLGQRTIAGETVIGELGVDPQRSGISQ